MHLLAAAGHEYPAARPADVADWQTTSPTTSLRQTLLAGARAKSV